MGDGAHAPAPSLNSSDEFLVISPRLSGDGFFY
jgi:hypothetical protein